MNDTPGHKTIMATNVNSYSPSSQHPAPKEVLAAYRAHEQAEAACFKLNKHAVMATLRHVGITRVEVSFDGSGDSGQIEGIAAFNGGGEVLLPDLTLSYNDIPYNQLTPIQHDTKLSEVLEYLSYQALNFDLQGWENNNGAHGTITFDVEAEMIDLTCNTRYIDYSVDAYSY